MVDMSWFTSKGCVDRVACMPAGRLVGMAVLAAPGRWGAQHEQVGLCNGTVQDERAAKLKHLVNFNSTCLWCSSSHARELTTLLYQHTVSRSSHVQRTGYHAPQPAAPMERRADVAKTSLGAGIIVSRVCC